MSISSIISESLGIDKSAIVVDKDAIVHGEPATKVDVALPDGRTVTGTFTTESKPGFGGVEFSSKKDIPKLMISKVNSVLAGTHG